MGIWMLITKINSPDTCTSANIENPTSKFGFRMSGRSESQPTIESQIPKMVLKIKTLVFLFIIGDQVFCYTVLVSLSPLVFSTCHKTWLPLTSVSIGVISAPVLFSVVQDGTRDASSRGDGVL